MSIHGFIDQNGQIQKYDYDDLDNKPTIPEAVTIDATLTQQGQAADAKAVGDAIENLDSGLSEAAKTALLNCFANIAWINANGQTYYDALEAALERAEVYTITNTLTGCTTSNDATTIYAGRSYSATISASSGYTLTGATVSITMGGQTVTGFYNNGSISIPNVTGNLVITVTATSSVSSISAVFTQGSAVIYDTDSLDTLKQYLVVTATFIDSSTTAVTDYTLSGTLAAGTCTIVVSYGEKTTTFDVVVTQTLPSGYTHLNYVTANGNQYISTSITEAQAVNWGWEVKESQTGSAQGNGHMLSSTNMYFPFLGIISGTYHPTVIFKRYGNEASTDGHGIREYTLGNIYTIKAYQDGNDIVYLYDSNENEIGHFTLTKGTTGLTSTNTFTLFTYGGSISTTKYRFHGNFYYAKLSDSTGNLVHYFLPCKNASNVVGLYDVIDGVFYPPTAGTLVGA